MFIIFEKGRCPVCGAFGKEIEKELFQCSKCLIAFDEFRISDIPEISNEDKEWN